MAKKIKVTSKDAGKRVDAFLAEKLEMSRSQLALTFKDEQVFVNSDAVKPSYRIKESDIVTYELVERDELSLKPYNYPLNILYEDEHLIVINKDAGLVVHPAFGHHNNTLVNALVARKTMLSDGSSGFRPGIVHRLDKDTSGAIVVAKSNKVHEALSQQFKDQKVGRNYIALVKGKLTEEAGMIKTYLTRSNINYQKMMNTSDKGKLAITHFKVLKRFKTHMLLSLNLETGRTHQIRAHLEFINCSIEGDKLYGTNNRTLYKKGQLLHAHSLTFVHPVTNEELTVTAPLPSYFAEVTRQLEKFD